MYNLWWQEAKNLSEFGIIAKEELYTIQESSNLTEDLIESSWLLTSSELKMKKIMIITLKFVLQSKIPDKIMPNYTSKCNITRRWFSSKIVHRRLRLTESTNSC